MAERLMKRYGCEYYKLRFNHSTRYFGTCDFKNKIITLSRKYCKANNEEEVRETILHEIAHALTPYSGHDWTWYTKARQIGSNGERTMSEDVVINKNLAYGDNIKIGNLRFILSKLKDNK